MAARARARRPCHVQQRNSRLREILARPDRMSPPMTTLTTDPAAERERSAPALPKPRLGEELPIFCERCGYSLNGLPQTRCDHCTILQFHCPECGHHQPINTLRPAAHRILGRLRATAIGWSLFFKLNFFGWLLFAWGAMGTEWSYHYQNTQYLSAQT